ncbi:unnamed protein product [Rotaria sp. Silwood1]|nr:unnamed protein product [Rotaria sp. Silwood1]
MNETATNSEDWADDEQNDDVMNIHEKVLNSVVRLKSQELFGRFEIAYRLTTNEKFRSILISVSLLVIDSRQFIFENQQ